MEVRKGYVEHIVFRNNDNGYTVFQLVSEEEELTCVGLFSVACRRGTGTGQRIYERTSVIWRAASGGAV